MEDPFINNKNEDSGNNPDILDDWLNPFKQQRSGAKNILYIIDIIFVLLITIIHFAITGLGVYLFIKSPYFRNLFLVFGITSLFNLFSLFVLIVAFLVYIVAPIMGVYYSILLIKNFKAKELRNSFFFFSFILHVIFILSYLGSILFKIFSRTGLSKIPFFELIFTFLFFISFLLYYRGWLIIKRELYRMETLINVSIVFFVVLSVIIIAYGIVTNSINLKKSDNGLLDQEETQKRFGGPRPGCIEKCIKIKNRTSRECKIACSSCDDYPCEWERL